MQRMRERMAQRARERAANIRARPRRRIGRRVSAAGGGAEAEEGEEQGGWAAERAEGAETGAGADTSAGEPSGASAAAQPHAAANASSPAADTPPANGDEDSSPADPLASWVPVTTSDGQMYYYHAVTREVRWERPAEALAAKMEQRVREVRLRPSCRCLCPAPHARRACADRFARPQTTARVAARQAQRLAEAAAAAQEREAAMRATAEAERALAGTLRAWVAGKDAALLLQSVHTVVPARVPAPLLPAGPAEPAAVKRAFLRCARACHPDKLVGASAEEVTRCRLVFAAVAEQYDRYRAAHGL